LLVSRRRDVGVVWVLLALKKETEFPTEGQKKKKKKEGKETKARKSERKE